MHCSSKIFSETLMLEECYLLQQVAKRLLILSSVSGSSLDLPDARVYLGLLTVQVLFHADELTQAQSNPEFLQLPSLWRATTTSALLPLAAPSRCGRETTEKVQQWSMQAVIVTQELSDPRSGQACLQNDLFAGH